MPVTLIADASWCSQTQVGAWAAWFKWTPEMVGRHSGVFRNRLQSSEHAEVAALVNGLHCVTATFRLPPDTEVIAESDCVGALRMLIRSADDADPVLTDMVAHCRRLIAQHGLIVRWRHVKAHLRHGHRQPRHHVNQWCDTTARRLMRRTRDARLAVVTEEQAIR